MAEACVQPAHWSGDVDTLADMVVKTAQPGDHILVMSNGGFWWDPSETAGWSGEEGGSCAVIRPQPEIALPDKAFTPHPAFEHSA